jgi:signal transduction histidine kinase
MPTTSHRARKARQASQRQIETASALVDDLKKHQLSFGESARRPSLADFGAADLSPVPLALLSRGGTVLAAGSSLFRLFEARSDQVLLQSLAEFLPREDVSAFFKFLSKCENTRTTRRAEFTMAVPGRPAKDVLLIVSPAEAIDPQPTLFRAAFVDLGESETRDFGPRLSQENARLVEAIDGIVWEATSPMRFTFVSRQAERILGFPIESWMSDPDFWEKHIYHEDRDRVVQARAGAVRKPASHVLEYRMVTARRDIIWVKDSAVMLAGAPGWVKMCGIITDVTDVQHARENLKDVNEKLEAVVAERTAKMEQSLEAMETLCYGIAHDLKAPLRGLQGFITILSTDYEKVFDETAKQYTQRCQAALRRMGELIEAVLAYGRLNHTLPELVPIHTKPLVDRVLQSFEPDLAEKKAKVQVQMTLPTVIGNPYLLEQVFTNLIANAIKFAKPDTPPEIFISGTEIEPAPATPSEPPPPPLARLTVTDNGIGIAPEFNKRMFGMFQKLHRGDQYPGTGIGLAVVKRAVELMNGQVGVFSEPDHGSSFWIELPLAPEQ